MTENALLQKDPAQIYALLICNADHRWNIQMKPMRGKIILFAHQTAQERAAVLMDAAAFAEPVVQDWLAVLQEHALHVRQTAQERAAVLMDSAAFAEPVVQDKFAVLQDNVHALQERAVLLLM
jgi:hypothetical protein